jgi:glycerol-3-phosphate dehydrogenase (NAD(P)+)
MTGRTTITVLGGGAWGTALACMTVRAGHTVRLWARDPATVDAINRKHENPRYLPGIPLEADLRATGDAAAALDRAEIVLAVVPAQTLRGVLAEVASHIPAKCPLVLCAKGIEQDTGRLLSDVASELLPANRLAALSGPSFASDVAAGLPTAVTVASHDAETARELAAALSSRQFRCYASDDLTGVELGGALKNVLAIASGAAAGAGLGASAQAALTTRGFVELRHIAAAFGARPETIMGLSGLGDLILTCGSSQSRNFAYGHALGSGRSVAGLPLAEGVATAKIAAKIAGDRDMDAPIIASVDRILDGSATVGEAVDALLSRPLKSETENT